MLAAKKSKELILTLSIAGSWHINKAIWPVSEGLSESDPQIFQKLLLCIDNSVSHVAFDMVCIINFLPSAQALAWQTKLKKLDRKQDGFLCSVFSSRHIPRIFTTCKGEHQMCSCQKAHYQQFHLHSTKLWNSVPTLPPHIWFLKNSRMSWKYLSQIQHFCEKAEDTWAHRWHPW